MDRSLVSAVKGNKFDEVESLLKSGASPDACDVDGSPVLVTACDRGFISIGVTALMRAAFRGDDSLIVMLLSANADGNLKNVSGRTALHRAALNNHSKVVRILLENGCDMNIKDNKGETALQLSERENSKDAADAIKLFTVKFTAPSSSLPVNSSTPSVVDRLGPEGKAHFDQACKKGKVPGNTVLIDCMGEEDAGKSCLEASMTDKPFVEGQESTEGVKVKMMISQAVGHGTDWKELKSEEERQTHLSKLFAREFVVHDKEQQSSTAKPGEQEQNPQASSTESDLKANVNAKASSSKSMYAQAESHLVGYEDFKLAKEMDRDVDVAINVMEKNKEEMRKCHEMINVTMMDRGGQDQFLSTHAALMADNEYQSTACFVVIDGSKPLDEKVTTSKFRLADGSFIEKPRDVATTRADVIRHCFTALSAAFPAGRRRNKFFGKRRVKRAPATFMFATRKDKARSKSFMARQEQIVQEIIAEENFGDHIVPFSKEPYHVLFHVDNTKSGTGNPDPTIVLVKKMIVEMAREYWDEEEKIPLPWAMLDKGLGLLRMRKHKVLDLHDVCQLAARVCDISSDEECRQALRYLCSHGSIGFYHNVVGLNKKVLPNIQWVADVLAIFVTVLDRTRIPPELWNDLKKLHQEGMMSWNLAKYLMAKAGVEEANYAVILILLQLFNIISGAYLAARSIAPDVKVQHGQNFFVPSMVIKEVIKTPFAYQSAFCSSTSPPSLFFVPRGFNAFLKPLFYRLVTRIVSKYTKSPQLSRNQVILHLHKDVDLELVYTVKAVIATVYCPSRLSHRKLPADEVLCPLCDDVRVILIEQLTQAKERGMDGFQFDVCVHGAVDEAPLEYDWNQLASLDEYPEDDILLDKEHQSIDPPAKLDLWFDNTCTSHTVEVAADSVYDPDVILSAVLQQGHDRWLSIGLKLGFTIIKVNENTSVFSLGADKLKALFEAKAQDVGRDEAAKQLLAACHCIPQPIIMAVKDQLAGDAATAATQLKPDAVGMNLEQVAECKLTNTLLVAVADEIASYWREFAAHLDPDKFTVGKTSIIQQEHQRLFYQACKMLEDWISCLDQQATCRLIVKTFLAMDKRAEANSIFGVELVEYIEEHNE
ncbi:uncharacterized protein LOC134198527 isoform X2 [Corticium candelabrum]|uniref:uncharacterized protein LOC134198527 isoform X2 n=1 Tax=Corticium candelabrum TaxID=121492 RepID=UPI002E270248|nr:uncharacterized protein LOC134198527 isoform X2 [Corticium candelabrum]